MSEIIFPKNRIQSIDLLRGLIIVLMALDHTRDFFHADAMIYDPMDFSRTSVVLFFTRWITHFCAPVFMFLAGTSAYLVGLRKPKKELAWFLCTRGIWLIVLELTVVNFGWSFNIVLPFFALITIWALGISMIVLSLFIFLPFRLILMIGLLLVAGHNAFDNFHISGKSISAFLWSVLHDPRFPPDEFHLMGRSVVVGYPVLSWVGIIAVGYCFGYFYQPDVLPEKRKRSLTYIGLGAIVIFISLRTNNVYGDPSFWEPQASPAFTFLSYMNVTKYPPSLLYTLITLGPAILFLVAAENMNDRLSKALIHFGRVPMFFYLLHIYLLHALAMIAAKMTGFSWSDMVAEVPLSPTPKGYGFSLLAVYGFWVLVVLLLYPLCKQYDHYKSRNKTKWWLSYL